MPSRRRPPASPEMAIEERQAWAALAAPDRIPAAALASLLRRFGSAEAIVQAALEADGSALRHPPPDPEAGSSRPRAIDDAVVAAVVDAAVGAPRLLDSLAAAGIGWLTLAEATYPDRLRRIPDPPLVLFVAGDPAALAGPRVVAVVGTRTPTDAGRRLAARIAGAIAATGATVVSGLAIGIDGVAHDAALREGSTTVAVLGGGHRLGVPRSHRPMARSIVAAGGAVVSESGPSVRPAAWSFPRRNRIVAGLAEATIVVEAGLRSGALITARLALEQGRDVYLAPGRVGEPKTAGSLGFLREHAGLARIVAGIDELLEDLGLATLISSDGSSIPSLGAADLGVVERSIAAHVADASPTLDELVERSELAPASVLTAITRLELLGLVIEVFGRYRPAGRLATRGPAGLAPRAGRHRERGASAQRPSESSTATPPVRCYPHSSPAPRPVLPAAHAAATRRSATPSTSSDDPGAGSIA